MKASAGLPATATAAGATAATAAVATAAAAATVAAATAGAAAATVTAAAATTAAVATTAAGAGLGLEAVVAVDGTITARLEGNLGFFAAGTAGGGEHFAVSTATAETATAAFTATTGSSAGGAAPGFIGESLGLVKFLFASGEGETSSAIATGKGFVGERHSTTSKNIQVPRSSSTREKERLQRRERWTSGLPEVIIPAFGKKKRIGVGHICK
jgi:hypothetical protein